MLQLSGNNDRTRTGSATLVDLRRGDAAILDRIDLPGDDARRLMELGFLPGTRVVAGQSAPGGDPRVFQVDGSEIALRRETARRLKVRFIEAPGTPSERLQRLHELPTAASRRNFRRGSRRRSQDGGADRPAQFRQRPRFSTGSPAFARRSPISRASPSSSTPASPNCPVEARRDHRSARRLQPAAAFGRRAGGLRRPDGQARRTPPSPKPSCWCSIRPTWPAN